MKFKGGIALCVPICPKSISGQQAIGIDASIGRQFPEDAAGVFGLYAVFAQQSEPAISAAWMTHTASKVPQFGAIGCPLSLQLNCAGDAPQLSATIPAGRSVSPAPVSGPRRGRFQWDRKFVRFSVERHGWMLRPRERQLSAVRESREERSVRRCSGPLRRAGRQFSV